MESEWFNIKKKNAFSHPPSEKKRKSLAKKYIQYQSTRNFVKHFPRRADIEVNFGQRWQMDLCDLGAGKAYNIKEGEKRPSLFTLICIDLFSKKIYGRGLLNKKASTVAAALKNILEEIPKQEIPKVIQSDGGGEFNNRLVKSMLKDKDIALEIKGGYLKNQVVERAIRSFKKVAVLYIESHWEEFKKNWQKNWLIAAPLILKVLNNRVNRSIFSTPNDVVKHLKKVQNSQIDKLNNVPLPEYFELLKKVAEKKPVTDGNKRFKVGDWVLVQHEKKKFEKETIRNYLYKPWQIENILVTRRPFMYFLRDAKGQKAKRLFYAKELILAPKKPFLHQIPVQKILDTRQKDGKTERLEEKVDMGKPFSQWKSI